MSRSQKWKDEWAFFLGDTGNIWLNRVGLYLHSFFACIIFSRSSSSNVLVNTSM